jgi:hypothetical protein
LEGGWSIGLGRGWVAVGTGLGMGAGFFLRGERGAAGAEDGSRSLRAGARGMRMRREGEVEVEEGEAGFFANGLDLGDLGVGG